jgi:hypothetical protein
LASVRQRINELESRNTKLESENHRLSHLPEPAARVKPCNHPQIIEELQNQINDLSFDKDNLDSALTIAGEDIKSCDKDIDRLLSLLPGADTLDKFEREFRELQNSKKHSDELARALTNNLLEWESVGLTIIPNKDSHPPAALDASIRVQELINALKSMAPPKDGDPPGPSQPTGSGMITGILSASDVSTIWNQIPASLRLRKENAPATSIELLDALAHLGCNHPIALAVALGDLSGNQNWDDSINQVNDLYNHECPRIPANQGNIYQTVKLFKASDVPKFTDTKLYNRYRGQLKRFLRTVNPPMPEDYGRALEIVLTTFEDKTAAAVALGWNVDLALRDTWEETINAFLQGLDDKFESTDILAETIKAWMACHPLPGENASEFFNRFEAVTAEYSDVQQRKGIPANFQIGPAVVTNRLIQLMPSYVRNSVRLALSQQTPSREIEMMTPTELRPLFEKAWIYATRYEKPAPHANNRPRVAAAPASNTGPNEIKPRACGNIVSYDSQPRVPDVARGSLYPDKKNSANDAANAARRKYCFDHRLCVYCRRPQAQHQAVGTNFTPLDSAVANARSTPAALPGREVLAIEDVPGRTPPA